MGLFWPVPEVGHPGTPRLFEGGRFFFPDGKARFHAVPFRESAEVVDDEYPVWLTTGRVVSQYLSGTQTRRIGGLVEQYPEPLCEMHPRLAERARRRRRRSRDRHVPAGLDHAAGPRGHDDPARHRVHPVPLARRQGRQPTDQPAVDPASKMPEFKVAAVRVTGPADRRDGRRP